MLYPDGDGNIRPINFVDKFAKIFDAALVQLDAFPVRGRKLALWCQLYKFSRSSVQLNAFPLRGRKLHKAFDLARISIIAGSTQCFPQAGTKTT
jgi:hypothetical protein